MALEEFGKGFSLGAGILCVESIIFAFTPVFTALGQSSIPIFLGAIELIQTLIVGFIASYEFVIGFLAGDLFMLIIFGSAVAIIAPAITVGMIISVLAVIVALAIRMWYEGEQ